MRVMLLMPLILLSSAVCAEETAEQPRRGYRSYSLGLPMQGFGGPVHFDFASVLAVLDDGMIEINLGSEEGLQRGQYLRVARDAKFLALAEVVELDTHTAIAKLTLEIDRQVRKGDTISSPNRFEEREARSLQWAGLMKRRRQLTDSLKKQPEHAEVK